MSAETLVMRLMRYSSRSQGQHLRVEDLPRELARLPQDLATVLRVGVVAEVGALVHEPVPLGVQHDAEGIRVLLEVVADVEVAEIGRVHVPGDSVAAGPVAAAGGPGVQRHADAVAGVEAGTADLRDFPAGPEVLGAPGGIGFEAAAREHYRVGRQDRVRDMHPADAIGLHVEGHGAHAVTDVDAGAPRDVRQAVHEPRTAAPGLHGQSAPEPHAPVGLERLAPVHGQEAYAMTGHPPQGVETLVDELAGEVRVRPVLRDPTHVVVEPVARIGAEVGACQFVVGEVRHERLDIRIAVVDDAHAPGREARVAAALLEGGAFEDEHVRTAFPCGDRGAQGRRCRHRRRSRGSRPYASPHLLPDAPGAFQFAKELRLPSW